MKQVQEIIKNNLLTTKESVRLFHGRGRLLSGLEHVTIDYFSPHLLITLYKESSDEFIAQLIKSIKAIPELFFENILLQKRFLPRSELIALHGSIPSEAFALEGDLKFHLKLGETQNIGFFLDMAPGRKILKNISKDKRVLNLFSYTCSLSVAALSGGAQCVVNVDMSKAALSVGEKNHLLNGVSLSKARFLSYDIMNSWKKIFHHGRYDIVVIDPPTNQGDSFKVERDYYKIVKRLNDMTNEDATILACLNSPYLTSQYLIDLFSEHAPNYKFQEITYSAFSSMETTPEEGLKIALFKRFQEPF